MNIIIVGCGKVGRTLVEQLSNEDHDIVVIDENPEKVESISNEQDAMGITGNGINHQTLIEAGIMTADLLIAVTGDDEKNLLCCVIAKKTGHCQTIARVRNPVYNNEIAFLKKEFGLAMIINPELTAANEISRIFQFPSAIRVDSFAKGHVELLHFKVGKNSPLIRLKLFNLHQTLRTNVLVCTVIRGEEVIIPNGDFEFQENDIVAIASRRQDAIAFFERIGIMKHKVQTAILAGGGKLSYYLAKILIASGIHVTIIEVSHKRCDELAELLPKATIICGDATDQALLAEEGLEHTQGFAALTGLDEENILLSLYAGDVSNATTVTKVNRITFNSVINELNLGSIIYPRVITADYILKYVRSANYSRNSNVETLYKLANGKAEALEFLIKADSAVAGIPLQKLRLRKNTLIGCIYRNGNVILPSGQDAMMAGDSVIVVLSGYRISDIQEILEDQSL
ncbi:MAG: Trk system potassium transporter TrkA [Roseburia sp.]|nr:Trk system potassium transporter TrkA [Roseburia sp.]